VVIEGGELVHAKIIAAQLFPGRQWLTPVDTCDEISLKLFTEMFCILELISYICNKKQNEI